MTPSVSDFDAQERARLRQLPVRVVLAQVRPGAGGSALPGVQWLAAATQDGAMKPVVMRAGDLFGNRTGGWFDELMVKDLRRGKFTYRGPLDVLTAWACLPGGGTRR